MVLYGIWILPVPVYVDTYMGHSDEYIQVNAQYHYTAMSPAMEVVHCCENTHLLRHRSENTCTSASYILSSGFGT